MFSATKLETPETNVDIQFKFSVSGKEDARGGATDITDNYEVMTMFNEIANMQKIYAEDGRDASLSIEVSGKINNAAMPKTRFDTLESFKEFLESRSVSVEMPNVEAIRFSR